MTNAATKKGNIGILNRTRAPKLEVLIPTAKANTMENTMQNINCGS